ncbi:MAG TPA: hypothetical protein VN690_11940, partial [Terriglobales bacterium]|nr:hypothetical protein [Terriglobales bacterium]
MESNSSASRCAITIARSSSTPSNSVWIAYPKQSSGRKAGVNRDIIRLAAASHGWHTVAIVALDDTWSALRL